MHKAACLGTNKVVAIYLRRTLGLELRKRRSRVALTCSTIFKTVLERRRTTTRASSRAPSRTWGCMIKKARTSKPSSTFSPLPNPQTSSLSNNNRSLKINLVFKETEGLPGCLSSSFNKCSLNHHRSGTTKLTSTNSSPIYKGVKFNRWARISSRISSKRTRSDRKNRSLSHQETTSWAETKSIHTRISLALILSWTTTSKIQDNSRTSNFELRPRSRIIWATHLIQTNTRALSKVWTGLRTHNKCKVTRMDYHSKTTLQVSLIETIFSLDILINPHIF